MIIPNSPVIKIMLFTAVGIFGPMLSIRERSKLSAESSFGVKWRRIKLFEAVAEVLVGAAGVFVFSLEFANIPMPDTVSNTICVIGFILMGCVAIVNDAYVKAEKKNNEQNL